MCFICDKKPFNNKTIRDFTLDISRCDKIVTVPILPKIVRRIRCYRCPKLKKFEGFLGQVISLDCSYCPKLQKVKVPHTIEELNCNSCDSLEKIIIHDNIECDKKQCKYIYASD